MGYLEEDNNNSRQIKTANTSGGGLFGAKPANTNTTSGGGLFRGQNNTANTTSTGGGLFGNKPSGGGLLVSNKILQILPILE